MSVLVQGLSSVQSTCADLRVRLYPDKPTAVSWEVATKLVDRRLARVVGFEDTSDFVSAVDGKPALYWMSPFSQGDGYGTAAEAMVYWLLQHGVQLDVHNSWFLDKAGMRAEVLAMLYSPTHVPARVGICMATPGDFEKLPTPYKMGFTMYESTTPLRNMPEWKHQCNAVDHILVPSPFCEEVFAKFVKRPISVIPLAINDLYCHPIRRKARDVFRVVSFATLTERKSPLEMIDVFTRAFPRERNVEFVLKTRLNILGDQHSGKIPKIDDKRVKVISDTWSAEQMRQFLYDADCMMFLSKGEGFGMTPREAMATGCPTMLADNTGMSPVCNAQYNWPVPTKCPEPSPLGGEWFVPDWDIAVDMLREIYQHRDHAYNKAIDGAYWLIENHGPSAAASTLVDLLETLDAQPVKRTQRCFFPNRGHIDEVLRGLDTKLFELITGFEIDHVKGKVAIVTGRLSDGTHEQLRYVVQHAMHVGAAAVALVFPSVYTDVTDTTSKLWRIEELQHLLSGIGIVQLRYIDRRQVALAVVSREGTIQPSFGHVIDRRWKPT